MDASKVKFEEGDGTAFNIGEYCDLEPNSSTRRIPNIEGILVSPALSIAYLCIYLYRKTNCGNGSNLLDLFGYQKCKLHERYMYWRSK